MILILLIEDEPLLRENTRELLEGNGYKCITANDGREGLKLAVQRTPDVIICDILLPFMDGFEIKRELNKLVGTASIPFIFLSAKDEREDLRKGMDLGAGDYITKPFEIKELINSVESRLTQKQFQKEIINTGVVSTLTDFIHISKHECNTPLHAIITFSDLMMYPEHNDLKFIHEASSVISQSGRRLFKTLNNLIELVRLKQSDLDNLEESADLNISHLLKDITVNQMIAASRSNDLNLYAENISTNRISREDLQLLIAELVGNAVKFSTHGSEVNVQLGLTVGNKNEMTLTISNIMSEPVTCSTKDIGPFTQFNREKTEQQGSGLGLYIALLIINRYNGRLDLETNSGQKFNVIISIPIV